MKARPLELAISTFKTLKQAPLFFFLLQIPEGISSLVAKALEGHFESNPIIGIAIFFPIFCSASLLSNSLTFIFVSQLEKEIRLTVLEMLRIIQPIFGRLIFVSLILGFVYILGFAALILPAFYFMAVYLFVPQIILSDPTISISLALFRSTQISKSKLVLCIFTVILSLAMGISNFLLSESFGRWGGGFTENPATRYVFTLLVDASLSMATSAMINIWISCLFIELTKNHGTH